MENRRLDPHFYLRSDVVQIAKDLIGKKLVSHIDAATTGGLIIETEAYAGPIDRASHAYNNRRTPRTEVMFHQGGIAYVYLCYGIHHLLNVVTNSKDIPHAVLIRAIAPTEGLDLMLQRRKKSRADEKLVNGPGSVCQALGITLKENGTSFNGPQLRIEEGINVDPHHITSSCRIGIDYAGEDALLPWRFQLMNFETIK